VIALEPHHNFLLERGWTGRGHRLTEDGAAHVLLLEAGGWDRDPWLTIPLAWGRVL
jgi:hypothetical protein